MKNRNYKQSSTRQNSSNKLPNSRLRQGHSEIPNPMETRGLPNNNARKFARFIIYVLFFIVVAITVALFVFMLKGYFSY